MPRSAALNQASDLFFDHRRRAEAIEACEAWIEANPGDAQGYFQRGIFYAVMKSHNLALMHFDRALALGFSHEALYFCRAQSLMALSRHEEAITDLEMARELDLPHRVMTHIPHFLIAECHRRLGRFQKCIDCCDQIPDDFEYPGFEGLPSATKQLILERVRQAPFV